MDTVTLIDFQTDGGCARRSDVQSAGTVVDSNTPQCPTLVVRNRSDVRQVWPARACSNAWSPAVLLRSMTRHEQLVRKMKDARGFAFLRAVATSREPRREMTFAAAHREASFPLRCVLFEASTDLAWPISAVTHPSTTMSSTSSHPRSLGPDLVI